MRRLLWFVVLAALAVLGCSSERAETPLACLSSGEAYLRAVEDAPQPVRLDGEVAISDCLVSGQDPGALAQVGESLVSAATTLNARALREPSGPATVQLGYLVGAVQEGASRTGGAHADLVRRLDAAARFVEAGEALPAEFERAFGRGYAAGQRTG